VKLSDDNHTFVQFPFFLQLLGFGVFTARKLHGDFKTIGMDIIKILHSTRYIIPGRAVSDSPGKVVAFKGQLISECLFDILKFPKNQRKI
jgi:hypothetical protein